MTTNYHEYHSQSKYLSDNPLDAGLCIRISGELLFVYSTARGNPDIDHCARKSRAAISQFSPGTGVRMSRYLRECTSVYRYMHTLTYPSVFPQDGSIVKNHLRRYCQELSREAKRRGLIQFSVFWFLEFQSRGAPHFHLFTTSFFSYKRCALIWYAIVDSGDSKHLKAGVRVETIKKGRSGIISYARKYARKQEQKVVPAFFENVGRFWGVHGIKNRVSAGTTFFVDSCLKPMISLEKTHVIGEISRFLNSGGLRLLKSSHGFRLYLISPWCIESLTTLLLHAEFVIGGKDDVFADAELTKYAKSGMSFLSERELNIAKRAYLNAKYGDELEFLGLFP